VTPYEPLDFGHDLAIFFPGVGRGEGSRNLFLLSECRFSFFACSCQRSHGPPSTSGWCGVPLTSRYQKVARVGFGSDIPLRGETTFYEK
jgi:hypothetical protein